MGGRVAIFIFTFVRRITDVWLLQLFRNRWTRYYSIVLENKFVMAIKRLYARRRQDDIIIAVRLYGISEISVWKKFLTPSLVKYERNKL